jgi:hypothetical protein
MNDAAGRLGGPNEDFHVEHARQLPEQASGVHSQVGDPGLPFRDVSLDLRQALLADLL